MHVHGPSKQKYNILQENNHDTKICSSLLYGCITLGFGIYADWSKNAILYRLTLATYMHYRTLEYIDPAAFPHTNGINLVLAKPV